MTNAVIKLDSVHPFYAMTVAVSNPQTGLEILMTWNFSEKNLDLDFQNFNRIILSSSSRQDSSFYISLPSFFMHFAEQNLVFFGNYFSLTINGVSSYLAFSIFADDKECVLKRTHLPIVAELQQQFTYLIQNCLKNSTPLIILTPQASVLCRHLSQIFYAGVKIPENCVLPVEYFNHFLVEILSSHLQTQMTTIIECKNKQTAKQIFDFLSIFMMKNQLELSSDEYKDFVIPGLFLQIVSPQQEIPLQTLYKFERPWTWIRYDSELVVQIPDISIQTQSHKEVVMKHLDNPQVPQGYSPVKPMIIASVMRLIQRMKAVKQGHRMFLCTSYFGDLVRKSVLMVELIENLSHDNKAGIVTPDGQRNIAQVLGIDDRIEMRMIANIASLIDKRVYKRLISGKRDFVRQFAAAM